MIKKSIIVLFVVILIVLVGVNLYVEKDTIQIKILNEFDEDEDIINLDNSKPIIIDENDYIGYIREYFPPYNFINYIYRANISKNTIELLKEIPEEYRTVTSLHYSKKDKKVYMIGHVINEEEKNSYLVRFNEDMEVEVSTKVEYFISNFIEIGNKIYAECNSEYIIIGKHLINENNNITMHEIDKNTVKLKEDESTYIFFDVYELKNGNRIIIKVNGEYFNKQIKNKEKTFNVIVEMTDNKGVVLSSNEVKNVYPYDIKFTELPNENVVFNLSKGSGLNPTDQIYIYEKENDKYRLQHKNKVKIPYGYAYRGTLKYNDNLGILISEVKKSSEGKTAILMFDENIEKLIKKYEIENLIGSFATFKIEIDEKTNKMYFFNNRHAIGEIIFPE